MTERTFTAAEMRERAALVRKGHTGLVGSLAAALDQGADAVAALTAAAERETALREAGKALVAALDACKSNIDSAFLISGVHGIDYDGPTYGVELDALRELLRAEP